MTARLLAGASGYSFKEWKGIVLSREDEAGRRCWPSTPSACRRSRSTTRSTGCRKPSVLENWARLRRREHFRFAIKASRRITHMARLKAESAADSVDYLYQQPGSARRQARAGAVPAAAEPEEGPAAPRASFCAAARRIIAPRSSSATTRWFDDDVYAALKSAGRGAVPVRARGQRAAAAGRDGAVGLRAAAARRTIRTTISRQWAERLAATGVDGDLRLLHARADRAGVCADADAARVSAWPRRHVESDA